MNLSARSMTLPIAAIMSASIVSAVPAAAQASRDVVVMRIPIAQPKRGASVTAPTYSGAGCGPLVKGWTVKTAATRVNDVSFGSAAENALRAQAMCTRRLSGPGACFIVASEEYQGVSTVFTSTSTALVPATNAEQQYATVCNAK